MPKLDAFTSAFIEAALWSTTGDDDEPLDKNYSASDIDPATLAAMERECADFQEKYGDLIEDDDSPAIDKWGRDEMAGREFWLTMNGHGAGFGDGNFPKHDDELYEAAKTYRGFDLYVGDDGVIYASGHEPPLPVSEVRRPILRPRPAVRSAHRAVRHPPRPHYAGEVRDMPNIFWRDIPPGSKVELVGHSYVVTKPDGTKASAYWSGNDAAVAQRTLDSMAQASAKGQKLPLRKSSGRRTARENGDDDGEVPDEEDDEGPDQSELDDGLVIGDARRGGYSVAFSGKSLGTFDDFDKALKVGVQAMHDSNYFPNIFYVNERGNVDLLSIKTKVIKGKVISVKYENVRSWV